MWTCKSEYYNWNEIWCWYCRIDCMNLSQENMITVGVFKDKLRTFIATLNPVWYIPVTLWRNRAEQQWMWTLLSLNVFRKIVGGYTCEIGRNFCVSYPKYFPNNFTIWHSSFKANNALHWLISSTTIFLNFQSGILSPQMSKIIWC